MVHHDDHVHRQSLSPTSGFTDTRTSRLEEHPVTKTVPAQHRAAAPPSLNLKDEQGFAEPAYDEDSPAEHSVATAAMTPRLPSPNHVETTNVDHQDIS